MGLKKLLSYKYWVGCLALEAEFVGSNPSDGEGVSFFSSSSYFFFFTMVLFSLWCVPCGPS